MKKIIILLLAALMLLLASGCSDKSLGIIGGADGPTAIIVTGN